MAGYWTLGERLWALDCLNAGDSLADIAHAAGRCVLDVACSLGVYQPSRAPIPLRRGDSKAWVGRLHVEVILLRFDAGESVADLARLAGVHRTTIRRHIAERPIPFAWKEAA